MKASLSHIGVNLPNNQESFTFWKELLAYLGFTLDIDNEDHFHGICENSYLCICSTDDKYISDGFNRKRIGLNHIAFNVSSRQEVDQFVQEFLNPRNIIPLYAGPTDYPDYATEYYAVYFEDPDRIKVEVVFEK